MNGGESPYIRTGYDYVFASRIDDKFAVVAKQDGIVTDISKTSVKVTYKDNSIKIYSLGEWSSKEESDSAYKHTVITPLTKNDKFKVGDVITYDKDTFELDMFDVTKLVYKPFVMCKMAMVETIATYEDSSSVSKKLNDKLGISLYKIKSFVIDMDTNIVEMMNVNDIVNMDTRLYTITNTPTDNSKLDTKSLEILQRLGSNSPKAKYSGKIDKIEVRYYGEIEEASESIKELIETSNKSLAKRIGKKITGEVDNQYSIGGKPMQYGQLEVKFYINVKEGIQNGDKYVFGLQLKNTIGELIDYDIKSVDTKEDVEILFSRRSVAARIVTAQDVRGTTNTLLKYIGINIQSMKNRKEVETYVVKYVGKVAGKENEEIYKTFFKKMDNKQFNKFLDNIKNGIWKINIIVPNGSSKLDIANNYKIAKEIGVEFYQFLDMGPKVDTPKYRTPKKVLVYDTEVRRVSQLLMKKISIPDDNRSMDISTGAVTGKSRGSKVSLPESTILVSYGLTTTLEELLSVRGGDEGKIRAMDAYLDKYGDVSLSNLEHFKTGVRSNKTLTSYLNASHIKNNFNQ